MGYITAKALPHYAHQYTPRSLNHFVSQSETWNSYSRFIKTLHPPASAMVWSKFSSKNFSTLWGLPYAQPPYCWYTPVLGILFLKMLPHLRLRTLSTLSTKVCRKSRSVHYLGALPASCRTSRSGPLPFPKDTAFTSVPYEGTKLDVLVKFAPFDDSWNPLATST